MKYFSMFSGIGGFELGIQRTWDKSRREQPRQKWKYTNKSELHPESINTPVCIGYSEIDKYAIKVYERHFNGHRNYGNATTINPNELPDFDLLVGGFPCQAFSIAGKRKGFDDTRGTLFFDIARILENKRPRHLVLENVKGLLSHDGGKTFQTILGVLSDLGYRVEWQILNSKDFGVPQNRERIFIIGHLRGECGRKVFPITGANKEDTRIIGQDVAYAIDANYHKGTNTLEKSRRSLVADPKIIVSRKRRTIFELQDISSTLTSHFRGMPDGDGRPAILQLNQPTHSNDRVYDIDGISPTLNTMQGGNRQPFIASVLTPDRLEKRQNGRRIKENGEPAFTVTAQDRHGLYDGARIRRLTPKECERLQGFPDDWTAGESDTQRYKMCGNAVTVNVIEAIMTNLVKCIHGKESMG